MDGLDLVLLIVVSYLAVTSLVRLMLQRRDRLIEDMHKQVDEHLKARPPAAKDPHSRAA